MMTSIILALLLSPTVGANGAGGVTLEVFVRPGCSYCAEAKAFLETLEAENLSIRYYDVVEEPEALERLRALGEETGTGALALPAFYASGRLVVGFTEPETTGPKILAMLGRSEPPAADLRAVELPVFGTVSLDSYGLVGFTVLLGLVDGFNPCAMWILLFLLSLLVHVGSRTRMFLIAGTFVLVSGIVYFGFMAAWLNIFLLIGVSVVVRALLGGLALVVGAINIKDFLAFKRGISLSIPDSAKPSLYRRVNRILRAEHLGAALAGVTVLAVLVNFVELLCTAGLPAVYTQILASQELSTGGYYAYLALYNLAYMADDGLMVGVAVATLSGTRLQESGGRWLKLVSGLVMAAIGLLLLFKPEWLSWGA